MIKLIAIAAFVSIGCGQTECQRYASVYCLKAGQCGYNVDGAIVRPAQDECETGANKAIQASKFTEAQCTVFASGIQAMTCAQFQAQAAGAR